jgi:tetratricopeptide (TPR) repeat protein
MDSIASWKGQPWINQANPSFPWEYTLKEGNDAFWEDIGLKNTVRFTKLYTQEELDRLELNPTLSKTEKLSLLKQLLEERLADSEAAVKPMELKDVDMPKWINLNFSIAGFSCNLRDPESAVEICRKILEQSPKSTQVLQLLSIALMECQQWAEAEDAAHKVLDEMNEKLGNTSPQSFGTYRMLIKITGRQRKFEEADKYLSIIDHNIAQLSGSKFEKYIEIEKTAREEIASELEDMKNNTNTRKTDV